MNQTNTLPEQSRQVGSAAEDSAQAAPDIVEVECWDSQRYIPENPPAQEKFFMEISDQRQSNGQLHVDIAPESGEIDDMLSVGLEIGKLPGSKSETQAVHLHEGFDRHCMSIYKQGDRFIIRLDDSMSLRQTVLPNGESAWILE